MNIIAVENLITLRVPARVRELTVTPTQLGIAVTTAHDIDTASLARTLSAALAAPVAVRTTAAGLELTIERTDGR